MINNEIIERKDNIIDLSKRRFPINSKAWHPIYRLARIVESKGNLRIIQVLKQVVVNLEFEFITVHVNELMPLAESDDT